MDKNTARSLFMDYLYDELDTEQRIELETFLKNNPDLLTEFNELRDTRNLIQNSPIEVPAQQYVVIPPVKDNLRSRFAEFKRLFTPQSLISRSAFAITFVLISTFLIASVAQVSLESNEAGWFVHFGPQTEMIRQGIDEDTVNELLSVLRQENILLATALIEEAQLQNEIQLREAVTAILDYMEEQRNNDLLLVGRGLAEIEQENYYRYIQTNETLSELLQNIQQ
jgi:hypothetical protein